MTKKPAFSLMEVMVILLILAVTLAATAPMISKKMSRNVGTAEEPWRFNGFGQSISFNGNNRDNATLIIGTARKANPGILNNHYNVTPNTNSRLYIKARGRDAGVNTHSGEGVNILRGSDAQAISFITNRRDVDNNNVVTHNPRIFGHLGMIPLSEPGHSTTAAYPFLSNSITRRPGLIIGNSMRMGYSHARYAANLNNIDAIRQNLNRNSYNATGDNVLNKVIVGYDMDVNERRSDFNGGDWNIAIPVRDIVFLGNCIAMNGVQRTTALGTAIYSGWNMAANPVNRSTIINTNSPVDIIQIQTASGLQPYSALNLLWSGGDTHAFVPQYTDGSTDIDLDRNQNSFAVQRVVILGGGNASVGDRNIIIGAIQHCGRAIQTPANGAIGLSHSVNDSVAIGVGDLTLPPVVGNNLQQELLRGYGANGNNSVAIGFRCIAGTQGNDNDLANIFDSRAERDNTVAIGNVVFARAERAVAIGNGLSMIDQNNTSIGDDGIAIGGALGNLNMVPGALPGSNSDVLMYSPRGIAIGKGALVDVNCANSIAIGNSARVEGGANSIAIGNSAHIADAANSVAIGSNAIVNNDNEIMLGDSSYTVRIPGNIELSGTAISKLSNQLGLYPSDIRLKNVGEKFTSGIEEIKKLEFFNYTFKNDKEQRPHVGVMAQDLQKVFPDAVTEGKDGYLTIRKDEMFYAALNAIKELNQKIIALAVEVKEFFARVDKLDLRVAKHQASLDELKSEFAEIDARLARLEEE